MYKVLVVDDEPLARARLRRLLKRVTDAEVVGEASDGLQAVEQATSLHPDVILMDIQMPHRTGLDAATLIMGQQNPAPAIIFCTAYDQFALDAIKSSAVAYLMKPVAAEELRDAFAKLTRITRPQIEHLRARIMSAPKHLNKRSSVVSRLKGGLLKTPIGDILFFRSADKLVYAMTRTGKEIIVGVALKELVKQFPGELVREHRNSIANIGQLESLYKDESGKDRVKLRDTDETLEVSRRQLTEVKKAFAGK